LNACEEINYGYLLDGEDISHKSATVIAVGVGEHVDHVLRDALGQDFELLRISVRHLRLVHLLDLEGHPVEVCEIESKTISFKVERREAY